MASLVCDACECAQVYAICCWYDNYYCCAALVSAISLSCVLLVKVIEEIHR